MITQIINTSILFSLIPHNISCNRFPDSTNTRKQKKFLTSYHYLQSPQIEQQGKNQVQKKIVVLDKGNGHLQQFIRDVFQLKDLEQQHHEIGQQRLSSLLNDMKTSGYFRNISIKSKIVNNEQTITIECCSMSPLKYIKIKNNKRIIIPEKLIDRLFRKQINKPQNYKLIHEALKHIYKWYYEKGFQWVNIKVIQTENEFIELEITEGIINSIQFRFIKNIEESTNNTKNIFLLQRVREFLSIKEGCRLNYNEIETKLSELKQKNIFENCDYTVLKSHSQTETIDLLISIYESSDRTAFLFGQNNNFRPGIVETIESKIFNSMNLLFRELFHQTNCTNNNNNAQSEYRNNINQKGCIPIHSYNSKKIINTILTNPSLFSTSDLYEWYANPIHFINSNHLGIHYNLQNIGKRKEYLKVNFKLPSVHKNLVLTYCKPWMTLYRKQNSLMQIKFTKESFYTNHKKVTDLLSHIFNHKLIFLDSLSCIKTLKGKIKTQLDNNWGLKQTIRLESKEQKKTQVYKKSEILFAKVMNDLKEIKLNQHFFLHGKYQLVDSTHSDFLSIDTKLKYKFSYNHDIDWTKTGSNCIILSKYSMPYTITSRHKLTQHKQKFCQRTILKYTTYKHYNFEQFILKQHLSFLDFEVGNLFGSSTFFPWTEKFELKFPDYITKNTHGMDHFPKSFYRIRFEHHLGSPQNHSVLFFFNYLQYEKRNLFYSNKHVSNVISKIADNNKQNASLNFGIGYQFKTSIHRLPPIRIELNINSNSGTTIYFRIIEVLSSIAVHKKI